MIKDKDKELDHLIRSSFGMAEEQNLEEFEAAETETTEEDRKAGDPEGLMKRLEEEKKKWKEGPAE